jgi:hypothetical protein
MTERKSGGGSRRGSGGGSAGGSEVRQTHGKDHDHGRRRQKEKEKDKARETPRSVSPGTAARLADEDLGKRPGAASPQPTKRNQEQRSPSFPSPGQRSPDAKKGRKPGWALEGALSVSLDPSAHGSSYGGPLGEPSAVFAQQQPQQFQRPLSGGHRGPGSAASASTEKTDGLFFQGPGLVAPPWPPPPPPPRASVTGGCGVGAGGGCVAVAAAGVPIVVLSPRASPVLPESGEAGSGPPPLGPEGIPDEDGTPGISALKLNALFLKFRHHRHHGDIFLCAGVIRHVALLAPNLKFVFPEKVQQALKGRETLVRAFNLRKVAGVFIVLPNDGFWDKSYEHLAALFLEYPKAEVIVLTETVSFNFNAAQVGGWYPLPCVDRKGVRAGWQTLVSKWLYLEDDVQQIIQTQDRSFPVDRGAALVIFGDASSGGKWPHSRGSAVSSVPRFDRPADRQARLYWDVPAGTLAHDSLVLFFTEHKETCGLSRDKSRSAGQTSDLRRVRYETWFMQDSPFSRRAQELVSSNPDILMADELIFSSPRSVRIEAPAMTTTLLVSLLGSCPCVLLHHHHALVTIPSALSFKEFQLTVMVASHQAGGGRFAIGEVFASSGQRYNNKELKIEEEVAEILEIDANEEYREFRVRNLPPSWGEPVILARLGEIFRNGGIGPLAFKHLSFRLARSGDAPSVFLRLPGTMSSRLQRLFGQGIVIRTGSDKRTVFFDSADEAPVEFEVLDATPEEAHQTKTKIKALSEPPADEEEADAATPRDSWENHPAAQAPLQPEEQPQQQQQEQQGQQQPHESQEGEAAPPFSGPARAGVIA